MTRTMQDSDITSGFTAGADIYGSYVLSDTGEGHDNYAAMCALPFVQGKRTLSICTRFNATAQCLDYENATTGTGGSDPAKAVAWTVQKRAQGIVPWNYCNESTWPELRTAYAAERVAEPIWWVANTSKPAGALFTEGASAHQFSFNLPANKYDSSVVVDYIPGFDDGDIPGGNVTDPNDPTFVSLLTNLVANTFAALQKLDNLNTAIATTNELLSEILVAIKAQTPSGGGTSATGPQSGTYTFSPEA